MMAASFASLIEVCTVFFFNFVSKDAKIVPGKDFSEH